MTSALVCPCCAAPSPAKSCRLIGNLRIDLSGLRVSQDLTTEKRFQQSERYSASSLFWGVLISATIW